MTVAVAGSSGFIGGAVVHAVKSISADTVAISAPRLLLRSSDKPRSALAVWRGSHSDRWDQLVRSLTGVDVLVCAAGLARPNEVAADALNGANGVLPALLAEAAAAAGVQRFVHVSSAAVQGNRDPLDESPGYQTFSPYARSKILGEELLLEMGPRLPLEIVIHRATSVQGETRTSTQRLVQMAGRRFVPLCRDGGAPLPVALVENVGSAIAFLTSVPAPPPITLQPWEGMTVRSLLEAFGRQPRFISLPPAVWRAAAKGTLWRSPAMGRRLELLAFGQRQEASALISMGFDPPLSGPEAYRDLAARTRKRMGRSSR